jgi:hypothetical protein
MQTFSDKEEHKTSFEFGKKEPERLNWNSSGRRNDYFRDEFARETA